MKIWALLRSTCPSSPLDVGLFPNKPIPLRIPVTSIFPNGPAGISCGTAVASGPDIDGVARGIGAGGVVAAGVPDAGAWSCGASAAGANVSFASFSATNTASELLEAVVVVAVVMAAASLPPTAPPAADRLRARAAGAPIPTNPNAN